MKHAKGLAVCLAASVCAACASVRVVVDPPAPCPRVDTAAVSELEEMEEYDLYPAVRRYVIDEVEPFCDGIEAMRE